METMLEHGLIFFQKHIYIFRALEQFHTMTVQHFLRISWLLMYEFKYNQNKPNADERVTNHIKKKQMEDAK